MFVDYIIYIRDDANGLEDLKKCLVKDFKIKELRIFKYFLGIEIAYSQQGIFISQQKHIFNLLTEIGKFGCVAVDTPIKPNLQLEDVSNDIAANKNS